MSEAGREYVLVISTGALVKTESSTVVSNDIRTDVVVIVKSILVGFLVSKHHLLHIVLDLPDIHILYNPLKIQRINGHCFLNKSIISELFGAITSPPSDCL